MYLHHLNIFKVKASICIIHIHGKVGISKSKCWRLQKDYTQSLMALEHLHLQNDIFCTLQETQAERKDFMLSSCNSDN